MTTVQYRRPHGTEWEDLDLDTAMEMIADRVLDARSKGWQDERRRPDACTAPWG